MRTLALATKRFTEIDLLYHSFIQIRLQDVCLRSRPSSGSTTIYAHEVGIECEVCNTMKAPANLKLFEVVGHYAGVVLWYAIP